MSQKITHTCDTCRCYKGDFSARKVNCKAFEIFDGFIVDRSYIRPIMTEDNPCPKWRPIPKEKGVTPLAGAGKRPLKECIKKTYEKYKKLKKSEADND